MLAVNLIKAGLNTDLSWILYILLGLLLFIVIIGAYTRGKNLHRGSFPDQESITRNGKTVRTSIRKNPRK